MLTDKRVLVTGGQGFLGQAVMRELKAAGATAAAVDHTSFDLRCDIEAQDVIDSWPQVVIHLAANVGGIGANKNRPAEFFYDNMMMGLNVIEACRLADVKKVVVVGTVCAYPAFAPVPFSEESLWNGYPEETNAPYGVAKRALLTMCQAYRKQYGLNAIYLIPANLYGPGDNFDLETCHVIPAMIRRFVEAKEKGEDVILWGSGDVTREFLYVDDAARAIVMAADKYNGHSPVNIGTGKETKITALANTIAKLTCFSGGIGWDAREPSGQLRRRLDVSRAREYFGFEATTTLLNGLMETIEWFMKNRP